MTGSQVAWQAGQPADEVFNWVLLLKCNFKLEAGEGREGGTWCGHINGLK